MAELVAAAAASGDRLRTLRAMRDVLAQAMDEAPAAVVAQVTKLDIHRCQSKSR